MGWNVRLLRLRLRHRLLSWPVGLLQLCLVVHGLDAAIGVLLLSHSPLLAKTPFCQLVLNDFVKVDSLIVVGKVEADLTVVSLKRVEVTARRFVLKLVVYFL